MSAYRYIRIILIFIPIFFLGVLVYKDFVPSGRLLIDYDFCGLTPFVSEFSPHGRVLDIEKIKTADEKYCQQKMVIDPVYFDVRLPQRFDVARLTVWYQKTPAAKLQFGPAVDLSAWQWQLKDLDYVRNEDEWQIGTAEYDLSLSKMDNNRLRFLVSSPGLSAANSEIIFKKIEIEFIKEPVTHWSDVAGRVKGFISFSRLKFIAGK
jgi:hypothetical protein